MKPTSPQPSHTEREDVHVLANRCPYCHDDVSAKTDTDSVVCDGCLTRQHAACWNEAAACSSCGGTAVLRRERPPVDQARVRQLLLEAGHDPAEVASFFAQRPQPGNAIPCPVVKEGRRCGHDATAQYDARWYCPRHALEKARRHFKVLARIWIATLAVFLPALFVTLLRPETGWVALSSGLLTLLFGLLAGVAGLQKRAVERAHSAKQKKP